MAICVCGAEVSDDDGPTHPYMGAAPDCWLRFGLLQSRLAELGVEDSLVVDAYAAQHPTNAEKERRQRQSVAVHLVALCLHHERGISAEELFRFRGRTSATVLPALGVDDWPVLRPPASWGALNSARVQSLPDGELAYAAREWPAQVWRSWADEHDLIAKWAHILLGGERR